MTAELFEKMAQSIIDGDPEAAVALAGEAVAAGIDPLKAITEGFVIESRSLSPFRGEVQFANRSPRKSSSVSLTR